MKSCFPDSRHFYFLFFKTNISVFITSIHHLFLLLCLGVYCSWNGFVKTEFSDWFDSFVTFIVFGNKSRNVLPYKNLIDDQAATFLMTNESDEIFMTTGDARLYKNICYTMATFRKICIKPGLGQYERALKRS